MSENLQKISMQKQTKATWDYNKGKPKNENAKDKAAKKIAHSKPKPHRRHTQLNQHKKGKKKKEQKH